MEKISEKTIQGTTNDKAKEPAGKKKNLKEVIEGLFTNKEGFYAFVEKIKEDLTIINREIKNEIPMLTKHNSILTVKRKEAETPFLIYTSNGTKPIATLTAEDVMTISSFTPETAEEWKSQPIDLLSGGKKMSQEEVKEYEKEILSHKDLLRQVSNIKTQALEGWEKTYDKMKAEEGMEISKDTIYGKTSDKDVLKEFAKEKELKSKKTKTVKRHP